MFPHCIEFKTLILSLIYLFLLWFKKKEIVQVNYCTRVCSIAQFSTIVPRLDHFCFFSKPTHASVFPVKLICHWFS